MFALLVLEVLTGFDGTDDREEARTSGVKGSTEVIEVMYRGEKCRERESTQNLLRKTLLLLLLLWLGLL